jgi:hypothetical protein
MPMNWPGAVLDRLTAAAHGDGGWGYLAGAAPCTEPTCLACLALSAYKTDTETYARGLAWLARLQRPDGSVPVASNVTSPCWTTGLAILAWSASIGETAVDCHAQIEKAAAWLLRTYGKTIAPNPRVYGHDPTLTGWAWVENSHSWVEPTAYAVLALRAAGKEKHPRVRDGIRLILDRAIPGGGWNYGNTRVFANTLRPFPGPTGIALTALGGEPPDSRIDSGIAYLIRELQRVRAPLSLSWGLMGLSAWGKRPDESPQWLAECARRVLRSTPNAMYDALLLLADADHCPITHRSLEVATTHG